MFMPVTLEKENSNAIAMDRTAGEREGRGGRRLDVKKTFPERAHALSRTVVISHGRLLYFGFLTHPPLRAEINGSEISCSLSEGRKANVLSALRFAWRGY